MILSVATRALVFTVFPDKILVVKIALALDPVGLVDRVHTVRAFQRSVRKVLPNLADNPRMNIYKRHRYRLGAPHPKLSSTPCGCTTGSTSVIAGMPDHSIEDLLAERGIAVSRESIRLWCNKFGPRYAKRLKRKHQGFGDTFFLDEVFVKIQGKQHYLWRAVDQDGEVVDVFLQSRRDGRAAKRFFRRLIRNHNGEPRKIVTDKLRSYGVAHRELDGGAQPRYDSRYISVCQQPSRAFASIYTSSRAGDEWCGIPTL